MAPVGKGGRIEETQTLRAISTGGILLSYYSLPPVDHSVWILCHLLFHTLGYRILFPILSKAVTQWYVEGVDRVHHPITPLRLVPHSVFSNNGTKRWRGGTRDDVISFSSLVLLLILTFTYNEKRKLNVRSRRPRGEYQEMWCQN